MKALAQPPSESSLRFDCRWRRSLNLCKSSSGFGCLAQPPSQRRRLLNLLQRAPCALPAPGGACSTSFGCRWSWRRFLKLWLCWRRSLNLLRRASWRWLEAVLAQPPSVSSSRFGCRWRRSLNLLRRAPWSWLEAALAQPCALAVAGGAQPALARWRRFLKRSLNPLWRAPWRWLEAVLAQPPSESYSRFGCRWRRSLNSSSPAAAGGARSTSFAELLGVGWRWRLLNLLQRAPCAFAAAGGTCSTSFGCLLELWLLLQALAQRPLESSLVAEGGARSVDLLRRISSLSTASQPR